MGKRMLLASINKPCWCLLRGGKVYGRKIAAGFYSPWLWRTRRDAKNYIAASMVAAPGDKLVKVNATYRIQAVQP